MSVAELKSKIGIDELLGKLRQLDTPTLNYLVTSLRKVQAERMQAKPEKMMEEAKFWDLIDQIDWAKTKTTERLKPLITALATQPTLGINQFSERMAMLLYQLDGPDFTKPLAEDELGFSADTFLYARCFVVAKGETFYKSVLEAPQRMPTCYLEGLLYVANKAYEQKTGEIYTYIPSTNYESFFNQILWGEEAIVL